MKKHLTMYAVALLTIGLLLSTATQADALLVDVSITFDTLTSGRAVVSGDFDDTFLDPAINEKNISAVGAHWRYDVRLFRFRDPAIENFFNYSMFIQSRHISNPPPHSGETTPGLLLGGAGELSYTSLKTQGIFDTRSHSLVHPGGDGDKDSVFSRIDDLNGNDAGFLTLDNQVSATIDTFHTVPEPATVFLTAGGLMGLMGIRRWVNS